MTNSRVQILVDAVLPAEQAARIRSLSPKIELLEKASQASVAAAEVLYTSEAAFDPKDLPHLKWMQLDSVAVNHLIELPLIKIGIPIANVSGAYTPAVAECAIGMLLTLTRRFHLCHSIQLKAEWPKWPDDYAPLEGENCQGKTMAIIGYGSIGRHVGRIAQAMGVKVVACKRRPEEKKDPRTFCFPNTGDPEGLIPEAWFGPEEVASALQMADIIVVTVPLTPATRGMISSRELRAMRQNSYIVNVGRGPVIEEEALLDALNSGRIAGAALDVFASEPLPADSLFWKQPNVFISPHIGSSTKDHAHLAAEVFIENLRRYLDSRPLLNLISMDSGY